MWQSNISDIDPGDNVSVTVMRNKGEVTIEVEVDETHGGSRFGGLFDTYYRPSAPGPMVDINLDAFDDLDISIPNLNSTFRSSLRAPVGRDRDMFEREMRELRKELLDMQKDLRRELKTELDLLREMIDN